MEVVLAILGVVLFGLVFLDVEIVVVVVVLVVVVVVVVVDETSNEPEL